MGQLDSDSLRALRPPDFVQLHSGRTQELPTETFPGLQETSGYPPIGD